MKELERHEKMKLDEKCKEEKKQETKKNSSVGEQNVISCAKSKAGSYLGLN